MSDRVNKVIKQDRIRHFSKKPQLSDMVDSELAFFTYNNKVFMVYRYNNRLWFREMKQYVEVI